MFLVIDGPEGCGKSTQALRLSEHLRSLGKEVLTVRDPGTTRIGEQIRHILLDPAHTEMGMRCEMLLYMAARAQMMAQTILPALQAGAVVISDRFVSSTLAYQLGGDGLSAHEINTVGQIAVSGQWPVLTIVLDMPPEIAFARRDRQKDRIELRPLSYHQQVRSNYLQQAKADPNRYCVIDAAAPVETVTSEVWKVVSKLL